MNKDFNKSELIDDFLTGRLTESDRLAFEKDLTKDPLLKQEVDLQKDIVTSLKELRKSQLKQRLQSLEVPAPTAGISIFKIAASFLVASMIGAGIYFYLLEDKENTTLAESGIIEHVEIEPESIEISGISAQEEVKTTSEANVIKPSEPKNTSPSGHIERKKPQMRKPEEPVNIKENLAFMPAEKDDSDAIMDRDRNVSLPNASIAQENDLKFKNLDIDINSKTSNKFHYQYYNNKLFLYGSFDQEPYEILELNTANKKHLYLYFANEFYELKSNQTKITPLVVLKDKKLIADLNLLKDK
ncbi:MAG: hypothetical protein ACK4ND_05595 [Cytophagaceae bacterium]